MIDMKFSSENIIFGVGSFSYQYMTRDTLGFAMKATNGVINGRNIPIFKEPKTDSGTKKSARGLLRVVKEFDEEAGKDEYVLEESCTWEQVQSDNNELKEVFRDGKLLIETSLSDIRKRIYNNFC